MDETSRKLERDLARGGDALARVRLANEKLRSGDPRGALELLGVARPDEPGVAASTRALAHLRAGSSLEALESLEAATRAGVLDLEPAVLLETLAPSLAGKTPLGRARAARVLARVAQGSSQAGIALLAELTTLAKDPDPLVRVATRTERPAFDPRMEWRRRVFGSHGADYVYGRVFVLVEAPLEVRLRCFEPELFHALATALGVLSDDSNAIEGLQLLTAFGEGYGLGSEADAIEAGLLERSVERLDALDLFPWRLRTGSEGPYDVLEEPRRLSRWLGHDLLGHLGRQRPFDPASSAFARLLALHPLKGGALPSKEQLAPVLEECRREFSSIGYAGCEEFLRLVKEKRPH